MSTDPQDSLPISLIAHTVFCPRRTWLEAVGERVESRAVEEGLADHQRVESRADDRFHRRRSIDVASETLGVHGRCDVVAVTDGGGVEVVEYKSAPLRRSSRVTDAQRLQLALQGECLLEAGFDVVRYGVYFTTTKRHVEVPVTPETLEWARDQVVRTRAIVDGEVAPHPLRGDPRCERCSHSGVCLPDERDESRISPRIKVADPDGQVLHLTTPGARASLHRGRVEVVRGDESLGSIPLDRVQAVVVHGNVDVSTALIRELLWRSTQIVWCSGAGRVVGHAHNVRIPNGLPRVLQRERSAGGDLGLAREFIASKIANQATLLRRAARSDVSTSVRRLRALARDAGSAIHVPELLGIEGRAAAVYFTGWRCLFARAAPTALTDTWPGRIGRGAEDPLNVTLNYVYGMLLAEVVRAVISCGLDPHAGFVHSSSRNKPALALDLMEELRPVVADSVVLGLLNNGELKESSFSRALGTWRLTDAARRVVVAAYERRVEQSITHPVFGYRVSWRRAMEVQARMVLGVVDGTQDRYVGIRVR